MNDMRARDFAPTMLALRAAGLGDLLTIVPAWRGLVAKFRGFRRLLATPRALHPLVEMLGGQPVVAEGLERLPVDRIVVAVNLHGRGPESHKLLAACRPAEMIAFENARFAPDGPQWNDDEHEVSRWCRLLAAFGIAADPRDLDVPEPDDDARRAAIRVAGFVNERTTVVHPGASHNARRWPEERFAAVARAQARAGRHVIVTGSAREVALAERVAAEAGLPNAAVVAGRTTLPALVALVHDAGRVVCGDTGIAHLATATRTPSVVLFGPSAPSRWGPPPDRPWHQVLWAGRTGDPNARVVDEGLLEISVDDVLHALDRLETLSHSA